MPLCSNENKIVISDCKELIDHIQQSTSFGMFNSLVPKSIFSEIITDPSTKTQWQLELCVNNRNNKWVSVFLISKNNIDYIQSIEVNLLFTVNDNNSINKHSMANINVSFCYNIHSDNNSYGFHQFIPCHVLQQFKAPVVQCWFYIQKINHKFINVVNSQPQLQFKIQPQISNLS